ncbi:hypothetical protein BCON_0261g00220 [Botryotinia convoluta]|uniref:Uncharacterized protein n=1 Tax=Botryotinia convoluta TaxID=54673 RepID=A0A4Z1HGD8_9HELO|nr:hypothetical protein BCON_0261g00220 [Botryotinia convoluta]
MPPTSLQKMKNQRSKCAQIRNELAVLLARFQQDIQEHKRDIETLKLEKIEAEMTGTCWQRLQYIALLNAWKRRLVRMEEQVEHLNEMDLKCVTQLEEVEKVLLQYSTLDPEKQQTGEN